MAKKQDTDQASESKLKLMRFLRDPDIQREIATVLHKEFSRYDPANQYTQEQVTMQLLHRDAADKFIEKLYAAASVPRERTIIMPKRLTR